jgi:soluble lytic murein transglycosylase-like protein
MEAAAKQRAASQVQTSPAPEGSFFTTGWASPAMLQLPPSGPGCPAMSASETDPLISKAATQYKLNPDLIRAVIKQESAFYPCAVSDKGAMGLMQLMPDTASTFKVADAFDPAQNIDSGARYMKQLLGRFKGDLKLALAAYNAGPEKVDGPKPAVPNIAETKDYVEQIVKALNGAPAETTP